MLVGGVPGKITGLPGSSATLRDNMLRAQGIRVATVSTSGFQAHHLIPKQIAKEFDYPGSVLSKIGFDIDDATNGIMLPDAVHFSRHDNFSRAIRDSLNKINPNQSDYALREAVYAIQAKAANAFDEHKAALRGNATSYSDWMTYLS